MTAGLPVKLTRAVTHLLLGLAAAVTLTPLVWLVAATTKGPDDLFHYTFFAPRLTAHNVERLFELLDGFLISP